MRHLHVSTTDDIGFGLLLSLISDDANHQNSHVIWAGQMFYYITLDYIWAIKH